MSLFHSIILGLIQGLTEFFPISSSGHLVIMPWLFSWKEHPLIFDIVLHLATFCAIIIYFRRDWINILRGGFLNIPKGTSTGSNQKRLFWCIAIASIPGVIFGGIVGERIEYYFRNPLLIALTLGIFGLVLYIAELYGKKNKSLRDLTWQVALLIGLSQMLAIIPGVSRSGITISAAMALGMNREGSVRFSFLLAAPILFAATCYGIVEMVEINRFFPWQMFLTGFITSFLSSLIAIHFLLRYIRRHPFTMFVVYRLAVSIVILLAYKF